jgi:CrcB protein
MVNLKSLFLVFAGSGLGGCVRWCFGFLLGASQVNAFPLATFMANVCACGISGFVMAWGASKCHAENVVLFWLVGFCGGFSTMSAFSRETLQLIQCGSLLSMAYPLVTLIACVAATYLGAVCLHYISS